MREIKGPEDIETMFSNANLRAVTAQEFGQALLLAMDAERHVAIRDPFNHGVLIRDAKDPALAWRELAERLRGK